MSNPHDINQPYRPDGEPQAGKQPGEWEGSSFGQSESSSTASSPWPVYGQTDSGSSATGSPSYAGPYYSNPSQPLPGQAPYLAGSPGSPSSYGTPVGGPMPKAPSRVGAIWTLVLGVVLMLVIAPIVAISTTIAGFDLDRIVDGSMETINGSEVVVDDSGIIGVSALTSTPITCTLVGANGEKWQMAGEGADNLSIGRDITPGRYTLECDGVGANEPLLLMNGSDLNRMINASLSALGWGAAIGFVGLVVTIVGIVWLVRRNRARREFQRDQWRWGNQRGLR